MGGSWREKQEGVIHLGTARKRTVESSAMLAPTEDRSTAQTEFQASVTFRRLYGTISAANCRLHKHTLGE